MASPPAVAWINSVPSSSPRNRGTSTHGARQTHCPVSQAGESLPVPAGCLAPAAPALPTLQPPGSNWIHIFIAERGNTGRWPWGHGELGPSLPAARLSPCAVCSAPRAMGRQTRPCRREQKPGQTEAGAAPMSRVLGFPGSQQPRDEGAQFRAQPARTPSEPLSQEGCCRSLDMGNLAAAAPAAPRVLSPKQRPEVKILNVPCWPDPAGGLGGTLPGRAEHPRVPRGARVS